MALLCAGNMVAEKQFKPKKYPQVYKATEESLSQHNNIPEWFKDAKLGIYSHWGLYSIPAFLGEWYAKWMHVPVGAPDWGAQSYSHHCETYGDPAQFPYHNFIPMFKAEHYNPASWVELYKQAGARFAGAVVQHHDGFAMWDSDVNPNNAGDEGPKRDLAGEFLLEAHKQDLKTIATFHHSLTMAKDDKDIANSKYYPSVKGYATSTNDAKRKWMYGNVSRKDYLPYWENIVYEVVDRYHPDMIWFDSGSRRVPTQNFLNIIAHHFNATTSRGQEAAIFTKESHRMQDIRILDKEQGGLIAMPDFYWMTDLTLSSSSGWCYVNDQTYKSLDLLIRNMIDAWSKRGIVLLNISPTAAGEIPMEQQRLLRSLGNWMADFGEAIYGTRAHSTFGYGDAAHIVGSHAEQSAKMIFSYRDVRFTRSKDGTSVYVFLLGQAPSKADLNIEHVLENIDNKSIAEVSLLGCNQTVDWEYTDDVLRITAPEETFATEIATVFKIKLK